MAKILMVDDDKDLTLVVEDWLAEDKHTVDSVHDGEEGLDRLKHYSYDLAILDWNMPKRTGIEICRVYRSNGGRIPIILLTANAEINQKETGLDAGADDYLTKPFDPRELSARIRALLRRPSQVKATVLEWEDIKLDPVTCSATKNGAPLTLMPKEYALLEFFMRHPNEIFSQEALIERIWTSESESSSDTVRVHLARLRKQIDGPDENSIIKTIHRRGYQLVKRSEG